MTNLELIRMLVKHPPDAEVQAFDPEIKGYRSVTGCVTGPEPVRLGGAYTIELQTDNPF